MAEEKEGALPEEVPQKDEPTKDKEDSSKEVRSDESEEKLKAMESELGRLRQELGDTRKQSEEYYAYKLWYDQVSKQQQVPQQQEKPDYDSMWLEKPTETYEQLSRQREMKLMYQSAMQQAPMAKSIAKMQHPEAFEDITDAELDQAMYGGVQSGTTNPSILGDPNAWVGAAWILRGPKSGYKMPKNPPKGMNPMETEKPSKSAQQTDEDTPELKGDYLTELLIREAKKEGISREEFAKKVHENKGAYGR